MRLLVNIILLYLQQLSLRSCSFLSITSGSDGKNEDFVDGFKLLISSSKGTDASLSSAIFPFYKRGKQLKHRILESLRIDYQIHCLRLKKIMKTYIISGFIRLNIGQLFIKVGIHSIHCRLNK